MASIDEGTGAGVVRLSDLRSGQDAECFAALVKKVPGTSYKNEPFIKCYFRDRRTILEAPVWSDSRFLKQAETWPLGTAYRLRVHAEYKQRYGLQLSLQDIRPAGPEDVADGYDFRDLVESTEFDVETLWKRVHDCVEKNITSEPLRRLVVELLNDHAELFKKMQAATNFHHSYTGGLLEHVWSMTRITTYLGDHYAKYYHQLNPPLDRGVIIAATVLHDIGKLVELEYDPVEARYTKSGCLIGHVQIGRDLVRAKARQIEGFPEETLLLLEHAILAHHGKKEFGAPVLPQTIEALIVSFVDDLDAKVNVAVRERLRDGDGEFTDKIFPLDNRRFYRGVPIEQPPDPADAP